ncbi:hypothetical protein [Streptantibioticus silvisoli]|uniref:ESX secretion-associated protein EspG n=1 Tax=Streptantibioticus silvisoli TaxID=2705255 RepID=A0ABT6W954_9ACTN|nr:hypothetical protein [Streptantibioticus silvisoli]MDI5966467.1 hypothetical protein [Streptantibioticus silvisoli]
MNDDQRNAGATGPGSAGQPDAASVPEGLVTAVVGLVDTGPVMLGAYTIAELTAVDAIVDFLEARPSDEVLAEAVRSLAARQLLLAGSSQEQVEVRGDLGIAVAFQQRARMVLDARSAGTEPGEPWRILVLPQPERICLVVRIDALGVHEIALHKLDETLRMLTEWLPRGSAAGEETVADADVLLTGSERSALVTVTEYTAQGSAEIAGDSRDLILARRDGRLHALSRKRSAHQDGVLEPATVDGKDGVRDRLLELIAA